MMSKASMISSGLVRGTTTGCELIAASTVITELNSSTINWESCSTVNTITRHDVLTRRTSYLVGPRIHTFHGPSFPSLPFPHSSIFSSFASLPRHPRTQGRIKTKLGLMLLPRKGLFSSRHSRPTIRPSGQRPVICDVTGFYSY